MRRVAPVILLTLAVSLSSAVAAVMLFLSLMQPWLGLTVHVNPDDDSLSVVQVHKDGPSANLSLPARLIHLQAGADPALSLSAEDLLEEPDKLPSYSAMQAFFDRQDQFHRALLSGAVELRLDGPDGILSETLQPAPRRALSSLPFVFWAQIMVGLAGVWIGAWIWSLRPSEPATRCLAISGLGLMISAFPAAVYSSREIALAGDLFEILSAFNTIGAITFGIGMIGLFLVYPKRLVADRWIVVPVMVFGLWKLVDLIGWLPGTLEGRHLPILTAMLTIILLVAAQYRATRHSPTDRAALTWLGIAVIIGAGAFVGTVIAPVAFGNTAVLSQGYAFIFFLLIYVGVALGVARFQLFNLDEWAFRILFTLAGAIFILLLDAILIMTLLDDRVPAFAASLLIVSLVWLPLRDELARRILHRREPDRAELFRRVMDVALTVNPDDQRQNWRNLLDDVFNPLAIQEVPSVAAAVLEAEGQALIVPGLPGQPAQRLEFARGGKKLFSPRDSQLAGELSMLLGQAIQSRMAYEQGAAGERLRIARDIHDNIGVQLMGALHSREAPRKDLLIRETLRDLRDIINNATTPDLPFDETLADLRQQISESAAALGVELEWDAKCEPGMTLPVPVIHMLRSVVREAVQNALKHSSATYISVDIGLNREGLMVRIRDDGQGFDEGNVQAGDGLRNMRARARDLGAVLQIRSLRPGTEISLRLSLAGRSAA